MSRLLEKDSMVYKTLCSYANKYGAFPGSSQLAHDVGYQSAKSAVESLRRLEAAGHIEIAGNRLIKSILLHPSGVRLGIRRTGKKFKKMPGQIFIKKETVYGVAPAVPFHGFTLAEVSERNGCRYPFGDNDYLFCGKPRQARSAYCPAHHDVCRKNPDEPDDVVDVRLSLDEVADE